MTSATVPSSGAPAPTLAQRFFRRLCRVQAWTFYRRREVDGLRNLPESGPVILCANHVNALADAVVVVASCPRPIHPLARSGLFRNPLLRPILRGLQAVPIYRRRPGADEETKAANEDSFRRCYELLASGRVILIFPEGQSHSDPMLRPLKTGAARLALGTAERTGVVPAVVPVGLVFTNKGRFRTSLLVQFGKPVRTPDAEPGEDPEERVRRFTEAIEEGLRGVTINVESWQDLALLRQLQAFFELRRGRREARKRRRLSLRVRAQRRLIDVHRWLRATYPEEVERLTEKLQRFSRLCRRYGVRDYQLDVSYSTLIVLRFALRSLAFVLFVFPLALWGALNSGLPFFATQAVARVTAKDRDQYDSAGMLIGIPFFLLAWAVQIVAVDRWLGRVPALAYTASLPITAMIALLTYRERVRIVENVRAFFLFVRKRRLKEYLLLQRRALELDVARVARLARTLGRGGLEDDPDEEAA